MIRAVSPIDCLSRCAVLALLVATAIGAAAQSTVYEYQVPAGGYDGLGNVTSYSDTVNGDWSLQYDPLSRLGQAVSTSGLFSGITLTEQYDAYGNRLSQQVSSSSSASASVPQSIWTVYDTNGTQTCPYSGSNRICATNSTPSAVSGLPTDSSIGMTAGYDAAGNFVSDGVTYARYDAEGRMCASYSTNGSGYTQYFYDAEGNRVAKATSSSFVCPGTSLPAASAVTAKYLVGQSGEQITELDGQNNWVHTNIYAAGALLATYNPSGMHFPLADPLGSIRMEVSGAGQVDQLCANLPFGDGQNCFGPDATEHHFTGKERDTESGLDYFGARYMSSSMGRFTSPDTSDGPDPVPFGDLENPQSLNLYSYVGNNPVNAVDEDGHSSDCGGGGDPSVVCLVTTAIDKIKNFLSGTSVTTSQQDTINVPAPAPPGVPEGAPGTATGGLIQAQNDARANPRFQPTASTTFCNMASCNIGQHAGSNMGPLMTNGVPNLANTDYNNFAHSGSYHRVGGAEAQRLANMGKVVYGVYKEPGHGHIITVRPSNGPYTGSGSPSTGPDDPIINDIGRHIGVYPLSQQPSAGFRSGVIFYAPN